MKSKINYRKARNEMKKVIARAMKQEAEEGMNVLCTKPNDVFKVVKFMRKERRNVGGGCMKDKDGDLLSVKKIVGNYGRTYGKDRECG